MSTAEGGLDIEVISHNGMAVIGMSGELTGADAPSLRAAIDSILDAGDRRLQLTMRDVTFIDSSGLAALVAIRLQALSNDARLRILGLSKQVMRALELTGLDAGFDIVE